MANPLSQIHTALWQLLESSAAFAALVPADNRIKLCDGNRYPFAEAHPPADVPQVRIKTRRIDTHYHFDSASSKVTVLWSIEIATGEQQENDVLDVVWTIVCAAANWRAKLKTLTYNSKPFVTACRAMVGNNELGTGKLGDGDDELDDGEEVWTSVWQGYTECVFATADLIAAAASGT